MKSYWIKVVATEFITVEAENEERAIELACERFGENIDDFEGTEIIESGKEC